MAASKHGRVKFPISSITGLPMYLLQGLQPLTTWNSPPASAIQNLAQLISSTDHLLVIGAPTPLAQNRVLREVVSPYLRHYSSQRREDLFRWIIVEWGQIKSGGNGLGEWVRALGNYDRDQVSAFIKSKGKNRVASWSKVLSFIDHLNYPVYDARNAIALNALLDPRGNIGRFYMPPTQNTTVPTAVKIVRKKLSAAVGTNKLKFAQYEEYRGLIHAMARVKGTDILDVEMQLFADSVRLAQDYIANNP